MSSSKDRGPNDLTKRWARREQKRWLELVMGFPPRKATKFLDAWEKEMFKQILSGRQVNIRGVGIIESFIQSKLRMFGGGLIPPFRAYKFRASLALLRASRGSTKIKEEAERKKGLDISLHARAVK